MTPKKYVRIWGNWKMNLTGPETDQFFDSLTALKFESRAELDAGLFVPTLQLERALARGMKLGVNIGAQNAHWEKSGAFTGETSGPQLLDVKIRHVLIGHSERRQFFGETEETAARRAISLLDQGFHVLFCIGENRTEREANQTLQVLEKQLMPLLALKGKGLDPARFGIAYEPVWAIGTGLSATPEQAEETHAWIRSWLDKTFGASTSALSLLYGGSVTPQNLGALLKKPNINGALVGGASLKPDSFLSLCQIALS